MDKELYSDDTYKVDFCRRPEGYVFEISPAEMKLFIQTDALRDYARFDPEKLSISLKSQQPELSDLIDQKVITFDGLVTVFRAVVETEEKLFQQYLKSQ